MNSRFLPIAGAVVALLLGLAAASLLLAPEAPQLKAGTLLTQPRALNDFSLTDQNGEPFTKASLEGRWSLVFPGFTHCPDVCPTTLAYLKTLHAKLADQGKDLNVVFLSVDPGRDGPEQLASYVRYFNPAFTGVTAQEPELSQFTQGLMISYLKVPGKTPETYTMDHSAALVLINPQGQVAGFFTPPFQLEPMAADLAGLIPSSSSASTSAAAEDCTGLEAGGAWLREAPPNAGVLAGFLTLSNQGKQPRTVRELRSPAFGSVEMHETTMQDGEMQMRSILPLTLAAGESVTLEPGGKHLMLMDPVSPLKAGDTVPLELQCGPQKPLQISVPVKAAP